MLKETFAARRHARAVARIEKKIARKKARLEMYREKKERREITPGQFANKKSALDSELRELHARLSTHKGAVRQEHYG